LRFATCSIRYLLPYQDDDACRRNKSQWRPSLRWRPLLPGREARFDPPVSAQ